MLMPDLDVAREFVASNPPPGRLLLCAVSGAHLYGFPSADSDLDLKGIHLAPTGQLLGLESKIATHDLTAFHRGVECDLTTNEAATAFTLLLAGNGNMLERILSPFQLHLTEEVRELQELAEQAISRAFYRHYAGFFRGCQREHERQTTAKTMLYSYRVALTGIHLLRSGELEPNLTVLAPALGYHDVSDLVALKQAGAEQGPLPTDLDAHHRGRWMELEERLHRAQVDSTLPSEALNRSDLEAWLIATRLADLANS